MSPNTAASTPVAWDTSASPFLTAPLRALLDDFLSLLQRAAYAPIVRTEVRGFRDPEEDTSQIIVRQWVALPAAEVPASLEKMGVKVEAWMDTLAPEAKTLFLEQITFQLRRANGKGATGEEGAMNRAPTHPLTAPAP